MYEHKEVKYWQVLMLYHGIPQVSNLLSCYEDADIQADVWKACVKAGMKYTEIKIVTVFVE